MDKSMKYAAWANVGLSVLIAAGLAFMLFGAPAPGEEPIPRSYNTTVYTEQGGGKLVVASGGEIEIQSGATLDVQSGATTDYSGGVDLDGALLDIDADGDTSIQADTDDQIDIEISAADDFRFTANTFTALAGSSLAANTIAETTAATGVTIDGLTLKDGGIQDASGVPITGLGDAVQLKVTEYTTPTTDAFVVEDSGGTDWFAVGSTGIVDIDVGATIDGGVTNIGGGTPDVAAGDNDLYVTGDLEVDTEAEFDGTVDVDGVMSIDSDLTFGEISAQTVGAGMVISSTGVYIPLTSGAAVTCNTTTCIEAGTVAGEIIILINENASDTITVDGTGGNVECKSDVVLGAGDTLVLMWDGADWRCLAGYDNS